jgi:hypothetical protein
MGEGRGGLEEDRPVKSRWWGLRPWKRHSTILMVVGFLFVLAGIQYLVTETTEGREKSLIVLLRIAPIQFWACLFIAAGLLAMLSSRWPPMVEAWGYMVLTGLSSGWAAAYLTGVFFFHSPATNVGQAIIWGSLAFMWWAISGFPNPERTGGK